MAEVRTTALPVLVELEGDGIRATSLPVLVEMAALGVYVTAMPVLVEMELAVLDYYAVADGHDIPASFLTSVTPQPARGFVRVTRRTHSANGKVKDEALYAELEFSGLGSVAEYQSVLTQFGIKTATENEVTVNIRDQALRWRRYNGKAVRPRMAEDAHWESYFPRNIKILIKELELLA